MTLTMFVSMLTLGSLVSGLLTEAVKKAYLNAGKNCSANMIALIDAIVVGMGGTAVTYMLTNTPWTVNNIICMVLMTGAVWIGSMIGYDKIIQLIQQLANIAPNKDKNE